MEWRDYDPAIFFTQRKSLHETHKLGTMGMYEKTLKIEKNKENMTVGSYVWGVRIGTILSALSWIGIVLFIDPERTGIVGQALFYMSAFLALSGIFILFLTWLHRMRAKGDVMIADIGASFRQGIFLASFALVLMAFQQMQILTWWDALLVAAGIFLVELYFLSKQ